MFRTQSLLLASFAATVVAAATACAPQSALRPPASTALPGSTVDASREQNAMPNAATSSSADDGAARTTSVAQVGGYRLTQSEWIRSTVNDSIYRFTNGSPATVSVIRYSVPNEMKSSADSTIWTTVEGERFEEVQTVLMQQGRIQNFNKAYSNTSDVAVDDAVLREHAIAIAVRASGATRMDFQYLYLVDGRFLKVRGTFPGDSWKTSDFPEFAREVARRAYRASR